MASRAEASISGIDGVPRKVPGEGQGGRRRPDRLLRRAPGAYADLQILAAAVEGTKSLEGDTLGPYIHANTFKTIIGDVQFGPGGEWAKPRQFLIQFQNGKSKDVSEFTGTDHLVVVGPPEMKTGELNAPFAKARQ